MTGYVANTDFEWFRFLRERYRRPRRGALADGAGAGLVGSRRLTATEVNFWFPSAGGTFAAIAPAAPLFFRLKGQLRAIGGFGFFVHFTRLPLWLAWETFGEANGCSTIDALVERIALYRARTETRTQVLRAEIGCVILEECVFFDDDEFVPEPVDWAGTIVRGKRYVLTEGEGLRIWRACQEVAARHQQQAPTNWPIETPWQQPVSIQMGAFRALVLDAYRRACAVTREHSLPVLEPAIIRPEATGGELSVRNGILLRADIQRLFERGYVTVTPKYLFEVSPRLRQEWENGRSYYPLHGTQILLPENPSARPERELLRWHNEHVFVT